MDHLLGAIQELLDVEPDDRRRDQAEVRECGVATSDAGDPAEHGAEVLALGNLLQS